MAPNAIRISFCRKFHFHSLSVCLSSVYFSRENKKEMRIYSRFTTLGAKPKYANTRIDVKQ